MTKERLFGEYASLHKDARNRRCHAIGIPLIVLGVLGLLSLARIGPLDLAVAAAVVTLLYYAALDLRGAAICAPALLILYEIGLRLPWYANLAAFVLGWGFQLLGHRYEGNRPKFLSNLVYLLIGPLFFFEELAAGALSAVRSILLSLSHQTW